MKLKTKDSAEILLFPVSGQDRQAYFFILFWFIYFVTDVEQVFFFPSLPLQSDSFTWVSPHLPMLYAQVVTSTLSFLTSPSLLAPCVFSLLLL